jgi:hypothetical protein
MFLRLKQLGRYLPLVLEGLTIECSRLNKSEEVNDFQGNYIWFLNIGFLGPSRQTLGKRYNRAQI